MPHDLRSTLPFPIICEQLLAHSVHARPFSVFAHRHGRGFTLFTPFRSDHTYLSHVREPPLAAYTLYILYVRARVHNHYKGVFVAMTGQQVPVA